jgi:hypothetical protein
LGEEIRRRYDRQRQRHRVGRGPGGGDSELTERLDRLLAQD